MADELALAREIARLADEVHNARTSVDAVADCMRDQAAALNANLRVMDRDYMESVRLRNDLVGALDKVSGRLAAVEGRIGELDKSMAIEDAIEDVADGVAEKMATREPTGQHALVPPDPPVTPPIAPLAPQSPVGLMIGRVRIPITWDGVGKAAWLVTKLGVAGSAAWAWVRFALAKWGHGGW